jgi:hypothetical protein
MNTTITRHARTPGGVAALWNTTRSQVGLPGVR